MTDWRQKILPRVERKRDDGSLPLTHDAYLVWMMACAYTDQNCEHPTAAQVVKLLEMSSFAFDIAVMTLMKLGFLSYCASTEGDYWERDWHLVPMLWSDEISAWLWRERNGCLLDD